MIRATASRDAIAKLFMTGLLTLFAISAMAQDGSRTWAGAVNGDFYNGGNWNPVGNFPNGYAFFAGSSNTTITRTSDTYAYLYGLRFINTLGTDGEFTLSPGGTNIFWGGPDIRTSTATSGSLSDEIGVNIQLAGSVGAGQTLKLFDIGANHDLTISGNVFGGNTTDYTFTKIGAGTLTLSGNNSYDVETTINGGTLRADTTTALGSTTAGTTVNNGAALQLNSGGTFNEPITINGSGVGGTGALLSTGANKALGGTLTLGSNASIGGTNRIDMNTPITDNGSGYTLTKTGTFDFVRGGAANFSHLAIDQGSYTVTGDTALPGGAGTSVTVNSGAQLTLWAGRVISNSPNIILNDGSRFAASRSVLNASSINGTMQLNGNVDFQSWRTAHTINGDITGTGALTLRSIINNENDARYVFAGNNTYSATTTVGNGAAGVGKMTLATGSTTGFSQNSAFTVTANSKLQLKGFSNSIGSLAGAGIVENANATPATLTTGADNSSTTFFGTIRNGGVGALVLTKVGTGTMTLTGASTYTGSTAIGSNSQNAQGGTLEVRHNNALGTAQVRFERGGVLALGTDGLSIANQVFIPNWSPDIRTVRLDLPGANSGTISGNQDVRLSMANGYVVDVGQDDGLTFSGDISTGAGGGAGITKVGDGMLVLAGVNTYAAPTTVNGGTLQIRNTADLAGFGSSQLRINSGSTLEIQSSVGGGNRTNFTGKTFTFDGGAGVLNFNQGNNLFQSWANTTFTTTASASGSEISSTNGGFMNMQGAGITIFEVADGAQDRDLALSAPYRRGRIVKNGAGTLAITTSTNTSFGNNDMTINAGTVEIGGAAALGGGSTPGNIANSGTFHYNSTQNQTLTGAISGNGTILKTGAGNLTLTGSNTFTGLLHAGFGTTIIGSAGAFGAPNVVHVASGATLDLSAMVGGFNPAGTTFAGNGTIQGGGSDLVMSGAINAPGNSPGTMNYNDVNLVGFGTYDWELADAMGIAGDVGGWDLITVTGAPGTYTVDPADLFSITGLGPAASGLDTEVAGNVTELTVLTTVGGIVGDPSTIAIDPGNLAQFGTFALMIDPLDANNLVLSFTSTVPEPGTWALFALLGCIFALYRRVGGKSRQEKNQATA